MTHIVRLPSGVDLPVPKGMDVNQFMIRHKFFSLSEGLCPYHGEKLEVQSGGSVLSPELNDRPWFHHVTCTMYWQIYPETEGWCEEVWWAWQGCWPRDSE